MRRPCHALGTNCQKKQYQFIPAVCVLLGSGKWFTRAPLSTMFLTSRRQLAIATLTPFQSRKLNYRSMYPLSLIPSQSLTSSLGGWTVSDGLEWDQTQGAFGWSMSDPTGFRCATCMGPAYGSAPSSYRSERYGMLSMLCFLRRLAELTGRPSLWSGIVATDSQSLLDT